MFICEKCNKNCRNAGGLSEHKKWCKSKIPRPDLCEYGCGKSSKFQFKNGKWGCSENIQSCPNIRLKNSLSKKGIHTGTRKPMSEETKLKLSLFMKGKTKDTYEPLKLAGETYKRKIASGEITPGFLGKHHTEETKKKISLAKIKNHNGGYKKVPYYDYFCKDGNCIKLRGTYEVRFAKILDSRNIEWNYQNSISYITNEGNERYILPDFYIPILNVYFDTKGYLTNDCKNKLKLVYEQTGIKIILIFKKDLEDIENGKCIKDFIAG